MANRRMFALTIIDSDAFLEMPASTQMLYFHLGMRADDDGFVNNPKRIMRMIGAAEDDLKLLFAKRFIIGFETGVVVIKHWKIHNYIQADRYSKTHYQEEFSRLETKPNKAYTERQKSIEIPTVSAECIQGGYMMDTQVRLGKDRLGKDRSGKDKTDRLSPTVTAEVVEAWNSIGLGQIKKITSGMERHSMLKQRINEYGLDDVLKAIEKAKESDFLHGINDRGWKATFDWFIRPNNFPKVLEGNYDNNGSNDNNDDLDELFRKRAT